MDGARLKREGQLDAGAAEQESARLLGSRDHRGEWRWTLKANNGEDIAVGSEGHVRREDC